MKPDEKWLALWKRCREDLECPASLESYFDASEEEFLVSGKRPELLDLGEVSFPTGQVLVRDPIADLRREAEPFFLTVPVGNYRATASVVWLDEEDLPRYAAVRVCFSDVPPERYEEALIGEENLMALEEQDYFGFEAESGLACICDAASRDAFCDFCDRWKSEHPGGDLQKDYFGALLAQSYAEAPALQTKGGTWLSWTVPGTEYHIPLFQSGFGGGTYPVYFGLDPEGQICQLVIQFIDLQPDRAAQAETLCPKDFQRNGSLCEGSVRMERWDSYFGTEGPYSLCLTVPPHGPLPEFTPLQQAGFTYVTTHQTEIADAILSALLGGYTDMQAEYGYGGDEKEDLMPDVSGKDGFAELLSPDSIYIHNGEKDGLPYIGYVFGCPWDERHGFGAMLHGLRVLKIGGADVALSAEAAEKDLERKTGGSDKWGEASQTKQSEKNC